MAARVPLIRFRHGALNAKNVSAKSAPALATAARQPAVASSTPLPWGGRLPPPSKEEGDAVELGLSDVAAFTARSPPLSSRPTSTTTKQRGPTLDFLETPRFFGHLGPPSQAEADLIESGGAGR